MGNKPQTLCWDCRKAIGMCSWSDHWEHRPVDGWTAVRNDMKSNSGEDTESWIVFSCPEFEPDEPKWRKRQ